MVIQQMSEEIQTVKYKIDELKDQIKVDAEYTLEKINEIKDKTESEYRKVAEREHTVNKALIQFLQHERNVFVKQQITGHVKPKKGHGIKGRKGSQKCEEQRVSLEPVEQNQETDIV